MGMGEDEVRRSVKTSLGHQHYKSNISLLDVVLYVKVLTGSRQKLDSGTRGTRDKLKSS